MCPTTGRYCDNGSHREHKAVQAVQESAANRQRGPPGDSTVDCVQTTSSESNSTARASTVPSEGLAAPTTRPSRSTMATSPPTADLDNWRSFLQVTRVQHEAEHARKLLEEWRYKTWLTSYSHQPFGPVAILPNSTLHTLATRTDFVTIDDLTCLRWLLFKEHGAEVLALLHDLDRELTIPKIDVARAKAEAAREEKAEEHETRRDP
ncbi:hypothetical protein C8Q79DRAFT_699003 [Trametes meyenii]|nr:hypothetical protein C8Q79DRAFT_699003 [Trametes meyenii]